MGKIQIGNLPLDKVFLENQEVSAIYLGDVLVYSKSVVPQLNAPVISLDNDNLVIEEVENAEYYDIYVDDVLEDSIDVRGFKEVTVYNDGCGTLTLYDGEDNTGTSLGTISDGETKTFHIESGYIVAYNVPYNTMFGGNFYDANDTQNWHPLGNPCQITEDISLVIKLAGGSND